MQTFASQWENYLDIVIPPEAGAIQKRETRAAFYAGAVALLDILVQEITPLPANEGVVQLEKIRREVVEALQEMAKE